MFVTILKVYYWAVVSMNHVLNYISCKPNVNPKKNNDIESNDLEDDEQQFSTIDSISYYFMILSIIIFYIFIFDLIYEIYK